MSFKIFRRLHSLNYQWRTEQSISPSTFSLHFWNIWKTLGEKFEDFWERFLRSMSFKIFRENSAVLTINKELNDPYSLQHFTFLEDFRGKIRGFQNQCFSEPRLYLNYRWRNDLQLLKSTWPICVIFKSVLYCIKPEMTYLCTWLFYLFS